MAQNNFASQVNAAVCVSVVITVAKFITPAFTGCLIIGVVIHVARATVIAERLIKIVLSSRARLFVLLAKGIWIVCLEVVVCSLG